MGVSGDLPRRSVARRVTGSSDYRPTVAQVAAHIRVRTKDRESAAELGTFINEFGADGRARTRPTATLAEKSIDHAMNRLAGVVTAVGEGCVPAARAYLELLAAADIERSYWSEQVSPDQSPYQALIDEAETARQGLIACVNGELPGSESDEAGDGFASIPLEVYGSRRVGNTIYVPTSDGGDPIPWEAAVI